MSLSRDHQQAADPHEPQRHPLRAVALVEAAVPHDLLRHQALGKGADGLAILASLNRISVPQFLHVPNVLPIRGPHALIDFAVQGDVPVLLRGDVVHDPAALAQLPAIQARSCRAPKAELVADIGDEGSCVVSMSERARNRPMDTLFEGSARCAGWSLSLAIALVGLTSSSGWFAESKGLRFGPRLCFTKSPAETERFHGNPEVVRPKSTSTVGAGDGSRHGEAMATSFGGYSWGSGQAVT
eukprot:CAMPEP_0177201668 /NCGR_PEP_ID=MMETSP0367-20130122/26874_1 /TAXON_ID=447022 ORGANISM="Scrippsiella hangoei-like, Strain SHHI-4" /NCGR_SAMPLE_ID=MMETSP0367 /ASSEMBLY_ACC=CAM_ASM_000362 /LENGTH=240 /DNA_ID=CAMNT_0018650187 /DNA_START=36 /DNA_END=755 /DNA_ORIENTATION=+